MSKGSLRYYLMNFCRTMTSEDILPRQITWPRKEEYRAIAEQNAAKYGFPGAIGCLDGTYIPIPGPRHFRDSYICRKGFPASHLQGVCDNKLKFLDVFAAYPGSVHDSRVFKNSPIANLLATEPLPEEYHLLGDSAYALSTYLLVPYRDNGHLTADEKRYNSVHSSTRVDIERCFGLLKGRFRKLKYLDMRNVREIPLVIVTCCVLHNFVINRESFVDEDIDVDGTDTDGTTGTSPSEHQSGVNKRQQITQLLS
ncbi:putative nuclease HARBI1 [Haliotis rubra]|uniref:putative nuclease HARBI1 n=1 Tax=Haliotis rubra TaxID=36100 RepID=UPI001EE5030B|nr:putative nuclease HARBI1 [Haliotis rubra]